MRKIQKKDWIDKKEDKIYDDRREFGLEKEEGNKELNQSTHLKSAGF